ncbi:hypothetical protein CSW63_13775 [Caulobacter sp. FWC26]|nr:hypothetical protein CSW63_13775 [Caulobacter sp. FWC26]
MACRRRLDAASRHAQCAGSLQASSWWAAWWPRGLGLRPRRASDRLPPSFGRWRGLQPGPREAAPPLAHPVSPTGAGVRRAFAPDPEPLRRDFDDRARACRRDRGLE